MSNITEPSKTNNICFIKFTNSMNSSIKSIDKTNTKD